MFKKKEKPKRDHSGKSLSQYGLFGMPEDFETGLGNASDDDENDEDLEAELAALAGEGGSPKKPKRPQRKIIPQSDLDAMVSETLKGADDEDDVSVDENDPDLLSELNAITGGSEDVEEEPSPPTADTNISSDTTKVLTERIKNYQICEDKAKESGEKMKAKRYNRALKTLNDLLKQANAGHAIDLNDESVPPDIHPPQENKPKPAEINEPDLPSPTKEAESEHLVNTIEPSVPASLESESAESAESPGYDPATLAALAERQRQYKTAALKHKHSGDAQQAVKYLKISKQFDAVIAALKEGRPIDLSNMPGPPDEILAAEPKIEESESQGKRPEGDPVEDSSGGGLITASSALEALEQRLAVYKEHETKAKGENNPSKVRRYGRIVKQFEQAIKAHKAGKPVAFDELPTPPGYGPIPGVGVPAVQPAIQPTPVPAQPKRVAPQPDPSTTKPAPARRTEGMTAKSSLAEKQMQVLIAKQKQFKLAALEAKKRGEISQAKEFLRQSKGFDKLIEASIAGLPVDWSSIPVSPDAKSQLDNEYNIAMSNDNAESGGGIEGDLVARLENQLQKQLKMCLSTRDHNKVLGDVQGANKFERMALNVTKDLDVVRVSKATGQVPKFHYENREFAIVKSFTEIGDNDMEVTIHRGISYKDKDVDTYVKMEFPFPQDAPFSDKTSTIKGTNNPEYQKTFVIPIQRNSRQCQRIFKRHNIKMEVYSKGCSCCDTGGSCQCWDSFVEGFCCLGFFRSDSLIGTVNVKLQPLETACEIHESFELMEGRKKAGGKLEVQIKLRTPIVTQQVEQIQEKWLIIDQ
ncbi:unnamed protein product [Phyllotreta striolata]|uniref:C2 domain-containing protein n=1 Tax=Phyllotreta striolata TaxID=444603 RepID=A0A9N9XI52_PHYSR|nr:unnamed protein product [Phyllotreta striolata]